MSEVTAAEKLRPLVEAAYADAGLLEQPAHRDAVVGTIGLLASGRVRVAERSGGEWTVNDWVKQAILLYFRLQPMTDMSAGELQWYDKIRPKGDFHDSGVRAVPPAVARHGAYLSPGVILMPSYVNIGAWIGPDTMVDTWATVGSCAQIGARVHLAGGVGIGGVLEPPNARPVIIEDDCFIGSRCIVTEGVLVRERAILGANVVLTASTPIIDVTGAEPVEHRGEVPAGAVVVPGVRTRKFPAGEYGLATPLVIGWRGESQDRKVSLNQALRDFGVST